MTMRCIAPAVAIGLLASTTSFASVTYVSASRAVSATCGTPQSFSTTSFGPYNQPASSTLVDPFPPNTATATANASNVSDTLPDRITWSLSANANDGIPASSGSGAGSANSSVTVRFTLDVDTPYVVEGNGGLLGVNGNGSPGVAERLTLVGGSDVFFHNYSLFGGSPFTTTTGLLPAGTYDFTTSVSASSAGPATSGSSASVSRQLLIPAPSISALLACGGVLIARRRRA